VTAHEFEARINPDGTLNVPGEVVARLPAGQTVRVLILVQETTEEEDWRRLTYEQFLKGYAEEDAIYDELPAG
jgi:hypothetical protein